MADTTQLQRQIKEDLRLLDAAKKELEQFKAKVSDKEREITTLKAKVTADKRTLEAAQAADKRDLEQTLSAIRNAGL